MKVIERWIRTKELFMRYAFQYDLPSLLSLLPLLSSSSPLASRLSLSSRLPLLALVIMNVTNLVIFRAWYLYTVNCRLNNTHKRMLLRAIARYISGGEVVSKKRREEKRGEDEEGRGREKEDCNTKMHIQTKEDEKYQELLRGMEIIRVG